MSTPLTDRQSVKDIERNYKMIKLPLAGDIRDSIIRVQLGTDEEGNPLYYYYAIVRPSSEYPLSQIPKGVNPRDLEENCIYKEIKKAYRNEPEMFLIYNGGVQATVDTGTVDTAVIDGVSYVLFSCDGQDNGHYDGQHSKDAVDSAISENDLGENNAPFAIVMTDDALFPDRASRRTAATRTNKRSAQQVKSEINIRNGFDEMKKMISYCPVENIQWAQNQKNSNGEKIKADCDVQQLLNMLAAFLPSALVSGGQVRDICSWPKKGSASLSFLESETLAEPLQATFEHVDFVLEMADFLRSSTMDVLGNKEDTFGITKMSTASQRKKDITDRKKLKTQLFNGETVSGGLYKDLLPMLLHAIISEVFDYDDLTGKYSTVHTMEEVKAMWLEGGLAVLAVVEMNFKESFEKLYKSRWSDFVLDDLMWGHTAREFRKAASRPKDWKMYLTHELVK
tara:strand:+ start:2049 stop:3404 length:1356 start_codon:yes stop_codon:yes gene_type:complete